MGIHFRPSCFFRKIYNSIYNFMQSHDKNIYHNKSSGPASTRTFTASKIFIWERMSRYLLCNNRWWPIAWLPALSIFKWLMQQEIGEVKQLDCLQVYWMNKNQHTVLWGKEIVEYVSSDSLFIWCDGVFCPRTFNGFQRWHLPPVITALIWVV